MRQEIYMMEEKISKTSDSLAYAHQVKLRVLREMTIDQSMAEFLSLCHDFAEPFDKTESVYRQSRLVAIRDLQSRLRKSSGRLRKL